MIILARGLKDAGPNADKEKVRTAIENIKGLVGTAGIFTLSPADHNGLDLDAFAMLTVKDGKFTVLEQ
jgi:branched-chain amino acid transport system substrate-binding protein